MPMGLPRLWVVLCPKDSRDTGGPILQDTQERLVSRAGFASVIQEATKYGTSSQDGKRWEVARKEEKRWSAPTGSDPADWIA